ncbi:MAG TPA: ABC transporter substrate-binding protein [Verrucomicrobiae bacterium]|nr:ABC transporter substrate-binding protein [Verrucomicrobiae bacterium]
MNGKRLLQSAAGLVGVGAVLATAGLTATHAAQKISIGFVVGITSDPYFITMQHGAEAEAKKLGVTLYWEGSTTTYSPTTEIPYVTAVLAKHPNALVLSPTNAQALIPSVRQARNLHIPVLNVDTYVNATSLLVTRIAGNNPAGGTQAAKLLAGAIGDRGQVLLLDSSAGVTSDDLRSHAFVATLKTFRHITLVGTQYSQDVATNAQTIVQQELSRYPNLKGIFAVDDVTAEGTIAELKALHKLGHVKVISYDAEPAQVAALKADKLVGLIAQQPALEGKLSVMYAVKAAEGKTAGIPKVIQVPNITITFANYKHNEQYFYAAH